MPSLRELASNIRKTQQQYPIIPTIITQQLASHKIENQKLIKNNLTVKITQNWDELYLSGADIDSNTTEFDTTISDILSGSEVSSSLVKTPDASNSGDLGDVDAHSRALDDDSDYSLPLHPPQLNQRKLDPIQEETSERSDEFLSSTGSLDNNTDSQAYTNPVFATFNEQENPLYDHFESEETRNDPEVNSPSHTQGL